MTLRQKIEAEVIKVEDDLSMAFKCRKVDNVAPSDMSENINIEVMKLAVRRKALRDVLVMIDFT